MYSDILLDQGLLYEHKAVLYTVSSPSYRKLHTNMPKCHLLIPPEE